MQRDTNRNANGPAQGPQSLKVIVLGATGGTGLELVKQAVQRGHFVTAFVRSPERLKDFQDRITVRQGDLLNSVSLEQAIQGQDAIVSGFGPRVPVAKADANLLERFARSLTRAMSVVGFSGAHVDPLSFPLR